MKKTVKLPFLFMGLLFLSTIALSLVANKLVHQRTVSQQRAYETVTASDGTNCDKITVGWPKKAVGDGYTIFRNPINSANAIYCGRVTDPNQTEIIDDGTLSCRGLQKGIQYHYVIYWVSPRTGNNNALGENTGYAAATCPLPSLPISPLIILTATPPAPSTTVTPTITLTPTPNPNCVAENSGMALNPNYPHECCAGLTPCPPPPESAGIGVGRICRRNCECPLKSQGDANCDGVINLSDFFIWRKEFLQFIIQIYPPQTILQSDFNNDNKVDLKDFFIWRKGFLRQ